MTYHDWDEIRAFIDTVTRHDLVVLYAVLFLSNKFAKEIRSVLAAVAGFIKKAETIQILTDKLKITLQSVKRLAEQSHDPELVRQTLLNLPEISNPKDLPEEGVTGAAAKNDPEETVDEKKPLSAVEDIQQEREELDEALKLLEGGES